MTGDLFLDAIAANPADRAVRLAYADWLEERNDSRHELVRVCERMRRTPVYSDEYWQLKARRNELRTECPGEWLAATGYDGSDYDPVFRDGVPADWKGRWRVVREFTERWHGIPLPDVGGRPGEIRAAESRVGVTLPPSVREYIAYAHDVFPEPGYRIVFRDPYVMERMPGHLAVSLMIQSEGDIHWAVQLADLGDPDPPVHTYVHVLEYDGPDETRPFVPYPDDTPVPVSAWALGYVESYNGAGSEFATTVNHAERLRRQLEAEFPVHRQPSPGADRGRYEHPAGILASFNPDSHSNWRGDGPYVRLCVEVRKGVSWRAIPEFLWEYARQKHMCSGMFLSQEDVEGGLTHWGNEPMPDWVPREAVPPMRLPVTPRPPVPPGRLPGIDLGDIPF
jgi:uncharacterized protein (TIGR02996 family)